MKTQTKKLQLNKETVAKLNDDSLSQVKGGVINKGTIGRSGMAVAIEFWTFEGNCTDGCTDGCGGAFTKWNCTKTNCTSNCPPTSNINCSKGPDSGCWPV